MKHKPSHHIFLALILFAINTVFFGAATWSTILATTANTAGFMLDAGTGNFDALATQSETLIPIVLTIIINIVLYYGLAAIILFIFGIFSKKKK